MAILAECPLCRQKQSNKNKRCTCGQDLDKAKRSQRIRYWISYRLPGGKQRREPVSFSLEEGRDAEANAGHKNVRTEFLICCLSPR